MRPSRYVLYICKYYVFNLLSLFNMDLKMHWKFEPKKKKQFVHPILIDRYGSLTIIFQLLSYSIRVNKGGFFGS